MTLYATYSRLDQRSDLLAMAAQAARSASASVRPGNRASAAKTATKIQDAAIAAEAKSQKALDAYDKRRKALAKIGWTLFGLAIAAMIGLGVWAQGQEAAGAFLGEAALALVALVGLGVAINGRVFGAAIDARNRVSLSKLQMLLWTVLAVAALAALLGAWLHAPGVTRPLDPPASIQAATKPAAPAPAGTPAPTKTPLIPGELLLAMGIAATSFVATPLLLSLKSTETPTDEAVNKLQDARQVADLANQGKVDARNDPAEASFADIFHGDEVGNAASIDVSKVQQIFITLLLLCLYGGAVFTALQTQKGLIAGLPAMNADFVKLLAISHASYLGYKAAPKTASAPTS